MDFMFLSFLTIIIVMLITVEALCSSVLGLKNTVELGAEWLTEE